MRNEFRKDMVPRRSTEGSSGYDFVSPMKYNLTPGQWTEIDTGVVLEDEAVTIPVSDEEGNTAELMVHDWFMLLAPRSGLGTKYGFRFRNTVGVVDRDYRGHIMATVTVDRPYTLEKGERFMQGIVIPFGTIAGEIVPEGVRTGGHGSTGRM